MMHYLIFISYSSLKALVWFFVAKICILSQKEVNLTDVADDQLQSFSWNLSANSKQLSRLIFKKKKAFKF